jgi:hypothetical protein
MGRHKVYTLMLILPKARPWDGQKWVLHQRYRELSRKILCEGSLRSIQELASDFKK